VHRGTRPLAARARDDDHRAMSCRVGLASVVLLAAVIGCEGDGSATAADPCVMKFPRGTTQVVAPVDQITQAVNECRGDDGACRAQMACLGSASGRLCDAKMFITANAAVCVAEANGLARGIMAQPRTGLVYDFVFRRITWNVSNTMYDGERGERPDGGGGLRGGQSIAIDAITAKLLNRFEWSSDM
jgi:hypothetical protein